jgi:hypothetical protein
LPASFSRSGFARNVVQRTPYFSKEWSMCEHDPEPDLADKRVLYIRSTNLVRPFKPLGYTFIPVWCKLCKEPMGFWMVTNVDLYEVTNFLVIHDSPQGDA